ncbi:MAG: threonylcarbamoyl-AMP synthase [Thaumarchaeota archaeon]|nr:threonylcarbamoyl-AMP synthase [Nitrososphaerota archaeon]
MCLDGRSRLGGSGLEPVVVRVFFPSVFVQVFVEVFVEFLVLFGHSGPADLDCTIKCRGLLGRLRLSPGILPVDHSSIAKAARIVKEGGLVVFPTDTVYGLGCDPFNEKAVLRLFAAKGRGAKAVPVLCSSAAKAKEVVLLKGRALELAEFHWPGALTIVAPLRRSVPEALSQGNETLGVRVPDYVPCLELIAACGGWLTGTSANLSGRPSAKTAAEAIEQMGGSVDLVLDGGARGGLESTVVRVVGDEVTILRTGPIGVGKGMKGRRTS